VAAQAGGASVVTSAIRVIFWGALAVVLTAGVRALFGVAAQLMGSASFFFLDERYPNWSRSTFTKLALMIIHFALPNACFQLRSGIHVCRR
jgi:hypothetical protein